MAEDSTAAIQALIKQVSALTETVEKQNKQINDQNTRLDNLHEFNGSVLDEKKDLERKSKPPTAEKIAEMASMGLELGSDGNWYRKGAEPKHQLTRAEARDPGKYREAKAKAEAAGATLQIVDPQAADDTHRRSSRTETDTSLSTTVVHDDGRKVAYMRRDVMRTDQRQYHQLRADGFTVEQWDNANDLPQHMQTKLALMEKANAPDS